MKRKLKVLAPVSAGCVILLCCYLLGWLLMPVRTDYGSTWESYLQEEKNTIDVMVFGSSIAYCDVIPASIYEKTGATCYIMAGAEQTIPISYYYLKQALKTHSPKVVLLEATGMFYKQYQSYTKVNIGYMPWSWNRLAATVNAAEPSEQFGLFFPLYNYHSRWREVRLGEIASHLQPELDLLAGYTFLTQAMPNPPEKERSFSCDTPSYRENLQYLQKIGALCREQGRQLVIYIAPTKSTIPAPALGQLKKDTEAIDGAVFLDCNPDLSSMGINDETDWFDTLHFNVLGAVKFSEYLGGYLQKQDFLPIREQAAAELWDIRAFVLHNRIQKSGLG